jgi:hypothetical protein
VERLHGRGDPERLSGREGSPGEALSALRLRSAALGAIVAIAVASIVAAPPASAALHNTGPPPPTKAQCAAAEASREVPPSLALDPKPHAPRVFAMQFKQDLANVVSYRSFRTKVECMLVRDVVPHLAKHRPNIVAFNEDVGLMTLATGSRGAAARAIFREPDCTPSPCGALGALTAISAAYSPQISAYQARFPDMGPLVAGFVGATDTFARGWMRTFADLARRYHVYMIGSNTQAPFRRSTDPTDIATFRDPDRPRPDGVYVATEGTAYNEAFVWGPRIVHRHKPRPLKNLVARNRKVPLTSLEEALGVSPGPTGGRAARANLRPYHVSGTRARLGIATSLPAFEYGSGFGKPPPGGVDPCSDVATYYMRCLDQLGANVVIQDEANPGRWATDADSGIWQPLEWMGSTWRAVADRTVRFSYEVTPFLVGNLSDLPFDGQTAIAQRGAARGRGCHFIGDRRLRPNPPESDPATVRAYAGDKRQFLAIAPWVTKDGPRAELRATGAALAAGSGSPLEDDYVETAAIADLPFPVDRSRAGCVKPG